MPPVNLTLYPASNPLPPGGTYTFNLWLSGILCSAVSRLWKQGGESDTLSNEEKVRRVRAAAGAWGQAALTKGAGWMEEVGKRSADKELKKVYNKHPSHSKPTP